MIEEKLKKMGFLVFKGHGNFLLVKNSLKKISTKEILKYLEKKNIYVRSLKAYNLPECFRVSVGKRKENILFLNEIKNLLKRNC